MMTPKLNILNTVASKSAFLFVVAIIVVQFAPQTSFAADIGSISSDIIDNIQTSRNELSEIEADISSQRRGFAQDLNEAQNIIQRLREQTAAARRLSDEQTLGLDQLEARLEVWREQSNFQSRILSGFNARVRNASDNALIEDGDLIAGLQQLNQYISERQQDLQPQWQTQDLVMSDGRIAQVEQLSLGPVDWFIQPELNQGGIVDTDADLNKVALVFSANSLESLNSLYQTGQGAITFDPTLSRALILEVEQESIMEHLQKGGIWVVPILLFAFFASSVALIKSLSLWRLPKLFPALAMRIEKLLQEDAGAIDSIRGQLKGGQAELLDISLKSQSVEQRDDRLFACLLSNKAKLDSWLGAIAVTAAVAPLLGLLGTVSGMITTFKLMTLFGAGDPSSVSSGISEALVTTELGLIVAIPALLAHALMTRKVKAYFAKLENDAIQLSQLPEQS